MTCAKCGTAVPPESKFCESCGEPIAVISASTDSVEHHPPHQTEAASAVDGADKAPNETVEKLTAVSKNYWNYYLHYLKAPTQRGMKENHSTLPFALINSALISLFFALTLYAQLSLHSRDSMFSISLGFSESFIPGLFYMVLFIAILTGGLFLAIKTVLKADINFANLFTTFSGLFPIPVALSLLAAISALIGIGALTSLFTALLFISLFTLMILTYQSYPQTQASIDPLYGLIGLFAVLLIVLAVVSNYLLDGILIALLI